MWQVMKEGAGGSQTQRTCNQEAEIKTRWCPAWFLLFILSDTLIYEAVLSIFQRGTSRLAKSSWKCPHSQTHKFMPCVILSNDQDKTS